MEFLTLFVTLILTFAIAAFSAKQFLGLVLQVMEPAQGATPRPEEAKVVSGSARS